jgi:hypothetical protein
MGATGNDQEVCFEQARPFAVREPQHELSASDRSYGETIDPVGGAAELVAFKLGNQSRTYRLK